MSNIDKKWLQQTIAEMEEHRDLFPGDLDDNHWKVLSALRIALASLEAEPYGYVHKAVYEEVGSCGLSNDHEAYRGSHAHIAVYTAPPVPVSVPSAMEIDDDFDSSFEHGKAVGWNAYRAAMLQGAKPVTTAYKLRDAVETIRNSGIVIDADKIFAERDALNSPVIPSGWVMVPVEPTEDMIVNGFESEPDESFSDEMEWEAYDAMSGCQQAAHRAKLCWAAMIAAAPKPDVR